MVTKNNLWKKIIFCFFLLLFPILSGCSFSAKAGESLSGQSGISQMKVHFIDVGQADSIFIELPNQKNMLIDAGTNSAENLVVDYIKNLGYGKIDFVVGTHPHEDHIGGLDHVIDSLDIGKIYLPKIPENQIPTTKTYESVLESIQQKGLKISNAKSGISIFSEEGLSADILSPEEETYGNLNNYSIVIKLTYSDTSFLFTGDLEADAESKLTSDLKADVLKVGHHGSSTSTSDDFLKSVSPSYAVISVGTNNKYGHPDEKTIQKLTDSNIPIYRTDQMGSIVFVSDGTSISISDQETAPVPQIAKTVFVTETGQSYHLETCQYVKNKKISLSLEEARKNYKPCSKCNPPK